jgi:hypothetical protein
VVLVAFGRRARRRSLRLAFGSWRPASFCWRRRCFSRCGRCFGCRRCFGWRRRWLCVCRSRALGRSWPNGIERGFARRRDFGGIALEAFKRIAGARRHASALRHEIGAAGCPDRRDLLGRRLLGRRHRSPRHKSSRNQHARRAPIAKRHVSLPRCGAPRCARAPPLPACGLLP